MHVIFNWIKWIRQSALIAKWSAATLTMIWEWAKKFYKDFLESPGVKKLLSKDFSIESSIKCQCVWKTNVEAASYLSKKWVFIVWDAWTTRTYKDWIWAAYKMAKVMARTVVRNWIWAEVIDRCYLSYQRKVNNDNMIWKWLFIASNILRTIPFYKKLLLYIILREHWKWPDNKGLLNWVFSDLLWWKNTHFGIIKKLFRIPAKKKQHIIKALRW